MSKVLNNVNKETAKSNVNDIEFFGNDDWKLLNKAWSEKEGWMKSTKAMQVVNGGVIVQITTQHGNNIAEAVTYIPGVKIVEVCDTTGKITSRHLVKY